MPHLSIFGTRVSVDSAGFSGPLGPGGNLLAIKSTSTGGGHFLLECVFKGKIPGGNIEETAWEMDCEVLGAEFVVRSTKLRTGGQLIPDPALQLGEPKTAIKAVSTTDRRGLGVAFSTASRLVHSLLDRMTGGDAIVLNRGSYEEDSFNVAPDFGKEVISFLPRTMKPRVDVLHFYSTNGHGQFRSEQQVLIKAVDVSAGRFAVLAHSERVYVHGDLVEKRPTSDVNQLFFQHVLVNGELELEAAQATPQQTVVRWVGEGNGNGSPAMLALRWRDENGHPLAFLPDSGSFDLAERLGFSTLVPDGGSPDAFEWSNLTTCIVGMNQNWHVHSLDPIAHYRGLDEAVHIQYGPVELAPGAPREIHGMASGVVLMCPAAFRTRPLPCTFSCSAVKQGGSAAIAWLPEIQLGGHGDEWSMHAFLEELESNSGSVLSVRSAPGQAGRLGPRLPLIDAMVAGVNLHSATGAKSRCEGKIVAALDSWLAGHDEQFVSARPSWLANPAMLSKDAQAHKSGFALLAGEEHLSRILNNLQTTASAGSLVPASPRLTRSPIKTAALTGMAAPSAKGYVHGLPIDASFDGAVAGIEAQLQKSEIWNDAWYRLINQWVNPDPSMAQAVDEVRRLLQVVSALPSAIEPGWEDDAWETDASILAWMQLRERAIELALMGDLDDVEIIDADELAWSLSDMDIDQFAQLCLAAKADPYSADGEVLAPLVRWLDAPAGPDVFRRIARLLLIPDSNTARLRTLVDICSNAGMSLVQFGEHLLGQAFVAEAPKLLTDTLAGILTDLGLAESALLEALRAAWKDSTSKAFVALRGKFGPILSDDLLDSIAASAADAQALLDAFNEAGHALHDLAEVIRRPPEYLFATRRFASVDADWDNALRLWCGRFGLAKLTEGIQWNFFLGDASAVIVKLGDKRSIADILLETHARYAAADRPDPLGLAAIDPAATDKSFKGGFDLLTSKLGTRLLDKRWTGLLLLRPTADISSDLKMRDLCGFEYINALFVAVAGRPLEDGRLDITAAIESRAEADAVAELKGRGPDDWQGDVDFGLTRFSVMIRRSVLDAADIAFQLRVKNLMGKAHPSAPQDSNVQSITLRGTLPPADPAKPDKPRDIRFAIVLDPPKRVEIGLFCLDYVDFSGLRVGLQNDRTYLDIDADLQLRPASNGAYPDFFRSLEKLKLQGFRLALPSLQPGEARGIGQALGLDFDWPSMEFSLPRARGLQLFGLEVTPTAFGILRKAGAVLDAEWTAFKAKFGSIDNWDLPHFTPDKDVRIQIPYLSFRLQFGTLPGLGGSGKLSFDLAFGVPVINGSEGKPFIAVQGFAGKDLELDLFRIITIKIRQLIFKRKWTLEMDGHVAQEASGLLVDQAELKILDWNPFGDGGRISLVNLHRTDGQADFQDQGFIAAFDKAAKPPGGGFVDVHWLVLGKNIELRKEAYDYLLAGAGSTPNVGVVRSMMDELLVYKGNETANTGQPVPLPRELVEGKLGARFTRNPNWLFALSFSLGGILELGNLVLHDQHYYGIRLRDSRWVATVFGQDTIEFAYIPGARRELDRFRTNLRIPLLDMLGPMTSGEIALEWAVNWDFLIDIGFPWRTANGPDWFRAFSLPLGCYEGKFGFYLEKKTSYEVASNEGELVLGCGVALYIGLYAGYGNSVAFVRAGIGIFGIFEGRFWLKNVQLDKPETLLKSTIVRMEVSGTIGIFAYAEGRIDVWILSASFRAWAQASFTSTIIFVPGATCAIEYSAVMSAGYSASCRVGSGWFSWTFRVSGSVAMPVSGRLLLA